jgi:phage terminase small subunit
MTDLQKAFCEEYVIDYHITDAGKRSGIKGENVNVTAWKMLQLPECQAYIEQLQNEASLRCQISKDDWLNEFKKIGFSNVIDYMTDELEMKPISEVKNPQAIKSIKKTIIKSDFDIKTSVEFTLHDKINGLVNIGKHLGWYEKDNSQQNKLIQIPPPIVYSTAPPLLTKE